MKVLIIGNYDEGLYKFRLELIQKLLAENHEVVVSTPYGEYIPKLQALGCVYQDIEYNRAGKNIFAEIRLLHNYRKLLKADKYDMVLLYTIKPTLYAGLICRQRKIPFIVNITGLSPALTRSELLSELCFMLYRKVLRHAKVVFFQNKENMELFERKKTLQNNARLIPGSGVNLMQHTLEKYEESDILQVLFVGRITKVKGIEELFEAIEIAHDKELPMKFAFVGMCDSVYEDRIHNMDAEGKLKYYGRQDNVHQFMKESQAVIMPSYGEGMSNVLLEASACGRPVLASDVTGCRDIVREGETGYLFETHSGQAIVEAFEKLLALTKQQREQMGVNGRIYVEKNFSRKIVVDEYMKQIK